MTRHRSIALFGLQSVKLHFSLDSHYSLGRQVVFTHFTEEETEARKEDGVCPKSREALVTELGCIIWWAKAQVLEPVGCESHLCHFSSQ